MTHFKFTAQPHGEGQWFPIGKNGEGDEVWCDGCIVKDKHLADRIVANMDAAYRAGLEVAVKSQIQHGIELLNGRGAISRTTTAGGWVVSREGKVRDDTIHGMKASIDTICTRPPTQLYAVVISPHMTHGNGTRPYLVPDGQSSFARHTLDEMNQGRVFIADKETLLNNSLDLCAEDFNDPMELPVEVPF